MRVESRELEKNITPEAYSAICVIRTAGDMCENNHIVMMKSGLNEVSSMAVDTLPLY